MAPDSNRSEAVDCLVTTAWLGPKEGLAVPEPAPIMRLAVFLGFDGGSLLRDRTSLGQLLETFVFQELRRLASWHEDDISVHHYRDRDNLLLAFWAPQCAASPSKPRHVPATGTFLTRREIGSVQQPAATRSSKSRALREIPAARPRSN